MFEPVQPVRAYERVVQQVEEAIFRGELRPQQRLPSERELMVQFAVSRSTIREALRVLQSAGLVRSRPGDPHGPEILPFTTSGLRQSLASLARVEHLTLTELIQFRMLIEGSANQLAASLRTDEELAAMEEAMLQMEATIGDDYASFSRADLAFHDTVAAAAGNKLLQVCNDVVRGVVLNLVASKIEHADNSQAQMRDSVRRHRLVLDAVRNRDGHQAAMLARKHLYEYYSVFLSPDDRTRVAALVEAPAARITG